MERDVDWLLDDKQWEDYVHGEQVVGYINIPAPDERGVPPSPGVSRLPATTPEPDYVERTNRLFCAHCGYLNEAHWHTTLAGEQTYTCPSENEARYRWGNI